jgi:hypothetical protein
MAVMLAPIQTTASADAMTRSAAENCLPRHCTPEFSHGGVTPEGLTAKRKAEAVSSG